MSIFGATIAVLGLLCSAIASPAERSGRWEENVHLVGETFPQQLEVRRLLGTPDSVKSAVVAGARYAPHPTLQCASLQRGTSLVVWRYRDGQSFTYLLYFKGS